MRTPARRSGLVCPIALLALTGCVSVTPDMRFPDVQSDVLARANARVVWRQGGPEDRAVDDAIAALLARPLSPEDAVQIALFSNSGLQATFEDLGIAQAEVVAAGQLRNPDIAGFFRFPDSPPSGLNWNLGVDIWLLDAFLVPIRQKLADASENQTLRLVTEQVLRLAADTRIAYFALHADTAAVQATEELAVVARLAFDLARTQAEAGNADDLALASERAAFHQAQLALLRARSAERLSLERLRAVMGLTDRPVSWSLAAEALLPTTGEPDEESLIALAFESRLDLKAAAAEVQRQEYALDLTKNWWLSTVRVGVETEKGSDGQYSTGPHFSAELPIFNQRQGEIARQEATIRQARRREESLQAQARTDVRSALNRVATAREIAHMYLDDVLPLRRQVLAATQDRYNSMFVGVFELLRARSELSDAQTASARALQEYWTARVDLEFAVGARLPDAPLPERTVTVPQPPPPTVAPSPHPHRQPK